MRKRLTRFEGLLLILCAALLLGFGASFGVLLVCGLCLGYMVIRRVQLERYPVVRKLFVICTVLVSISFIVLESFVISKFHTDDSQVRSIDYVVILGAGLRGAELSQTLRLRLDGSLNYVRKHSQVPVIVSGGQGPGESIPEAVAMQQYLLKQGIQGSRILLESKSTSTEENLLFTKELLEAKGVVNPSILIVTSDFHMFRAQWISKRYPFDTYGLATESPMMLKLNYMIREYFAFIKTVLW